MNNAILRASLSKGKGNPAAYGMSERRPYLRFYKFECESLVIRSKRRNDGSVCFLRSWTLVLAKCFPKWIPHNVSNINPELVQLCEGYKVEEAYKLIIINGNHHRNTGLKSQSWRLSKRCFACWLLITFVHQQLRLNIEQWLCVSVLWKYLC